MTVTVAPHGTWKSPITAASVAQSALRLGALAVDGDDLYWLELRPREGGRTALVRRRGVGSGAVIEDVSPPSIDVRTLVHEYGGGAYTVRDGVAYASNFGDQRLYALAPGAEPRPLTPALANRSLRYADGEIWRAPGDEGRALWIGVREDHRGDAVVNAIVAVPVDAGAGDPGQGDQGGAHEGRVLASGYDFYGAPRISPDGRALAWVAWNFPNMPWDGTELWVASLDADGRVSEPRKIAGGPDESIVLPEWSPDGRLYFASDRTDFWNLYRVSPAGSSAAGAPDPAPVIEPVCPIDAEMGGPMWTLGWRNYGFAGADVIVTGSRERGGAKLTRIALSAQPGAAKVTTYDLPFTELDSVRVSNAGIAVVAGAPDRPTAVVTVAVDTGTAEVVRSASERAPDPDYVSTPRTVSFPSADGRTAHGVYYPPHNRAFAAPEGELPPLLVKSHGGPTSAARQSMSLGIQFWTSRGFAVLDVDYGGSTGYGRAYRNLLRGRWGIVDVQDCAAGARYLVEEGLADPDRLAIDGGSAGGYTTLCALTFRDEFKAGASYFGVSDLGALAAETHKFESRYLDLLIGPYPERKDLYDARSPIHHVEGLSCPVIFLQGLEDAVVPPAQSERMADALRAKGIPVAYLAFEGEQHGFRKAENIARSLEAELYFFAKVFGFEPADDIAPVDIDNL